MAKKQSAETRRKNARKAAHQTAAAAAPKKKRGRPPKADPAKTAGKLPEQTQLFETEVNVTRKVKNAATRYREASIEKAKALAEYNAANKLFKQRGDELAEQMNADECPRVLAEIDGVRKAITLDREYKLSIKALKETSPKAGENESAAA